MKNYRLFFWTLLSITVFGVSHGFAEMDKPLEIKFALKYHMLQGDQSVLEKFTLIQEAGFDGLEVNAPSPLREKFKAAAEATGLPIHGVVCSTHWKKLLSDPDETVRAEGLEGFKQAIRDAHYYGATSVLLVPGKIKKGTTFKEAWERSIAEIRKALPLAEELNVSIGLENVWNDFLMTPEDTLRYIEELDHPLIKSYFDVGNAQRDSDPTQWPAVLNQKILKLDVKDYKVQPEGGNVWQGFRVDIGSGDVDWPTVCNELKRVNYSGWATAELKGFKDPERLGKILRDMKNVFSH